MEEKIVKINDREFTLRKWDLRRQLRNNNIVMPLVKDPIINGLGMSESGDEDSVILAILEGVITSLEGVDLEKVAEKLVEGASFRNDKGVGVVATLDSMSEHGLSMAEVVGLCIQVIKHNYGDLLKKDLLASLMQEQDN